MPVATPTHLWLIFAGDELTLLLLLLLLKKYGAELSVLVPVTWNEFPLQIGPGFHYVRKNPAITSKKRKEKNLLLSE